MAKHLEEKIDKHHDADWHKWAGFGSTISMILPVLSEFEAVGESVFLAIGGTSAVWGGWCRPLERYDFLKWPISKKNIDAINSKTPLEDLLTEKASILV